MLARRPFAFALALPLASGLVAVAAHASGGSSQFIIPAGQGSVLPPALVPGDRMGESVSASGDTVVMGGIGVWVFRAGMTGALSFEQRPFSPDQTNEFGTSVDIDGDLLVVGDPGDSELNANATARVFRRVGTIWTLEATLPEGGVPPYGGYGSCVAISGEVVVVGAPNSGSDHGLVYVFSREGGLWQQVALLSASNPQPGDLFGSDVDIELGVSGDTLVVGAAGARAGAWVFQRFLPQNFMLTATFAEDGSVAPGPMPAGPNLSRFGASVAVDDGTIVVGGPFDSLAGPNAGAVSFFLRSGPGTSWNFISTVRASDASPAQFFGEDVALSGDRALVGSPYRLQTGAVYVLKRSLAGVWEQETILLPGSGDPGDLFGISVALDADRLAIGSPQSSDGDSWAGETYSILAPPSFPMTADAFCFGDGGDQLGCTNCPCGNNAPAGSIGGCIHSQGNPAVLASMGCASASNDTLRFEVNSSVPNTFGSLLSAANQLPISGVCPPGSGIATAVLDGLRCVGVNLIRHGTRSSDPNGDIGVSNNGWGPPSGPPGGLVAQGGFAAGQTRFFQVFYRELPVLVCMTGLNTTNAIAVTVAP